RDDGLPTEVDEARIRPLGLKDFLVGADLEYARVVDGERLVDGELEVHREDFAVVQNQVGLGGGGESADEEGGNGDPQSQAFHGPHLHQPGNPLAILSGSADEASASRLPCPQQLQHLAIELMALEVFVGNVFPVAVENSEAAAKVPERPAPAGLFPDPE